MVNQKVKNGLSLLLALALVALGPCVSKSEEKRPIERTTHLTFKRFYFIARLENTIQLLAAINQSTKNSAMLTSIRFSPNDFKHKLVHQAAIRINQSKSIKPIFAVWDEFSSYKSLESELVIGKDDLFVKEFGQQLFFIAKNILSNTRGYDALKEYQKENVRLLDTEQLLDLLDVTTDMIEKKERNTPPITKFSDIKMHATTDEINIRFYHIERIKPCITILKHIKSAKPNILNMAIKKTQPVMRASLTHYKSDIQHTIEDMILKESADPMFKSWQDFRQYRKINDPNFPKDFCVLLFTVFKELHRQTQADTTSNFSIAENTEVEDILYMIDLVSGEVQGCMKLYEQEDVSFSEWLRGHWWIPVGALCTISLKLALHYIQKGSSSPT